MRAAAANLEFERAASLRDRLKRLRTPGLALERGLTMLGRISEKAKRGVLEVQEYLRLLGQVGRALVTRPIYGRDIVEQFDAIGIGSLAVVLLTGMFTGMVLALQSGHDAGPVRRAPGGRPPRQRLDGEGTRARC